MRQYKHVQTNYNDKGKQNIGVIVVYDTDSYY